MVAAEFPTVIVGEPLASFRGVLNGVPTFEGGSHDLLEPRHG